MARFTGFGMPYIFFFFPLKIVRREVLFRFGCPLLLMAGDIGDTVAGGAGDSNGAIPCVSMIYVLEGQNEAGS